MAEFIGRIAYFIAGWGVSFIVFLLGYLLVLAWVGSRRP